MNPYCEPPTLGSSFQRATEGPDSLSDGRQILETSPIGVPHVYAWDVAADLPDAPGNAPCDFFVRVRPVGAETAELPSGVNFRADTPKAIEFVAGGALDPTVHSGPLEITLE